MKKTSLYIYFLKRGRSVKIGISGSPHARLPQFKGAVLIGYMPGDRSKERALHKRFQHLAIGEEWFKASPQMMAYIHSLPLSLAETKRSNALARAVAVRFAEWQRTFLDELIEEDGSDLATVVRGLVSKEYRRRQRNK